MTTLTKSQESIVDLRPVAAENSAPTSQDQITRTTLQAFAQAFIDLDIDAIMALFAEDAVYCDPVGPAPDGNCYRGKAAIRSVFERQFRLFPNQTFRDVRIFVDGNKACSAFVFSLGNQDGETKFRGHDYLEVNDEGKVTLKNATIKGLSEMNRKAMLRKPLGVISYLLAQTRT